MSVPPCQIGHDSLHSLVMACGPFRVKISDIQALTPTIYEFTFALQDSLRMKFLAGQSLAILIPESTLDPPTRRYYSITSDPRKSSHVSILLNGGDQGKGSRFLLSHEVGDELTILGPFGQFQLHHHPDHDILFVATGTGIAPFRAMLKSLLHQSYPRKITLFWGLRSEGDLYLTDEFHELARKNDNFFFSLILSQANAQWEGRVGRVTDLIQEVSDVTHLAVYVCGNSLMIREVGDVLREKGTCLIFHE